MLPSASNKGLPALSKSSPPLATLIVPILFVSPTAYVQTSLISNPSVNGLSSKFLKIPSANTASLKPRVSVAYFSSSTLGTIR